MIFRWLHRKTEFEKEMSEELRFHVEQQTAANIAAGFPPEEARRRARLQLGAVEGVKADCREERRGHWFDSLWADARHSVRVMRRNSWITALAILTVAVGVGANTAIFSVIHAVLLNPLPYPDSSRLAMIEAGYGNELRAPASRYAVAQMQQSSQQFDHVEGIWVTNSLVPGDGEPEQVKLGDVTPGFLSLLCPRPALGRFFTPGDAAAKGPLALVISYSLWQRRFGGDAGAIGRTLRVNQGAITIVGVLPQDFRLIYPDDANVPTYVDIFTTIQIDFSEPDGPGFLHLIGRLRPGATFASAQSEADEMAAQLRRQVPSFAAQEFSLHVAPLHDDDVRSVRRTLVLLFAGVGFVLLIACTNVANLLLAKAGARNRELTIRAALGATRNRTIRQLLTEGILLSLAGGVAAVGVGWAALEALLAFRPESLLRLAAIRLDGVALAYTFAISLLSGIAFGLLPAFTASRVNLLDALKSGARGYTEGKSHWRAALVAAEVALSLALLIGTGLLVRTLVGVLRVNPGFQTENVLTFTTSPGGYDFVHRFQQSLAAIPGVESASVVSHLPFDGTHGNWYDNFYAEGTPPAQQSSAFADCRSILPGFFRTIGATLISGRDFTESDDAAHQHVAIIDDDLARETWPGQDPLGKKINVSDSPKGFYQFERDWVVVVGVVKHVQFFSLTAAGRPQIYVPFQLAPRPVSYVVRSAVPGLLLKNQIREQLSKIDSRAPVARVAPLAELVDSARAQSRFVAFLAATLAAIALLLAAIGIAGVTSYSVSQRTSEIGIRMTLGAGPGEILRGVLRQNLLPVAAGLLAGLAIALVLTPLLQSLLFGVKSDDPLTFAALSAFLLAVASFACYVPARRAMRVDPMVALRYE
ncbi:MAG TPA: ABC transporter permease [Candidatus Acidoferrales bacterium]|nr:ABC transporter permease [Candidatus Acidoferrales bacterium]